MLYGKSIYYFLKFQLFYAIFFEYFNTTKKVCNLLNFFKIKTHLGIRILLYNLHLKAQKNLIDDIQNIELSINNTIN